MTRPSARNQDDDARAPRPSRQGAVRVVQIADRPRLEPATSRNEAAADSKLLWLLPLVFLVAIVAGIALVNRAPRSLFGWTFGTLVGGGTLWIVVSTLFPAKADRACPTCGRKSLRRLDPGTTTGLVCGQCGWRDETTSSFFLAEAEGPIEPLVLAERGTQR